MITLVAMLLQASAPAPVELWNGITYGMPGIEVHNRFPKHSVPLTEDCKAALGWTVDDTKEKRLQTLNLSGDFHGGCAAKVRDGLRAKYGEPVWVKSSEKHYSLRNVSTVEDYRFERDGIVIDLSLDPGAVFGGGEWKATYSRSVDAKAMAGAL